MAAGIASAAQARELRFYYGDQQITEGATVKYTDHKLTQVTPMLQELKMEPELYIWSDMLTNTVTVVATSINGQSIQMCCGSNCISGTTVTKTDVRITRDQKLSLQFEYIQKFLNETPVVPDITVDFEAYDTKYPDQKITFRLLMGPQAAGVDRVETAKAMTVSGSDILYNLPSAAQVSVYDILGGKALETAVSGNGSLSLSHLPTGIYIYTVKGDAIRQSGKLVIR